VKRYQKWGRNSFVSPFHEPLGTSGSFLLFEGRMKTMKKFLALTLALVLALSLMARRGRLLRLPPLRRLPPRPLPPPLRQPLPPLPRLPTAVLTVAMECAYAPYNWTQMDDSNGAVPIKDSGEYANGYDVMIAKKICEANGWKLESRLVSTGIP
jgi:putative lysine transport system substrate-binding protein